jgi:hypothetical protein
LLSNFYLFRYSMVPDAHDPDKRHAPMMFTTVWLSTS